MNKVAIEPTDELQIMDGEITEISLYKKGLDGQLETPEYVYNAITDRMLYTDGNFKELPENVMNWLEKHGLEYFGGIKVVFTKWEPYTN